MHIYMHTYIYRKCTLQTLRVWASGKKGAGGSPSLPPSFPLSLPPPPRKVHYILKHWAPLSGFGIRV